jgi:hypothetical protein
MLLSWAATQSDDTLLSCRNFGLVSLAWVRANEPTGYRAQVTYGTTGSDAPEPTYIDRLREAVDLALFEADKAHSHPACRATFRRVAMAAFDAEADAILHPEQGKP